MRRVLVTGAAGFIGSHVARALLEGGAEVHALVRPASSLRRLEGLEDRISLVAGDLDAEDDVRRVVRSIRPDTCIHLAWYAEPGRYLRAARENLASLEAGVRLLRALLDVGCARVVLAGTCLEPPTSAGSGPDTVYAAAKQALHLVADRLAAEGTSVACAHVFHVYGPWEDERRVVPAVIGAVLRGEEIAVTAGEQRRDYLHVADVASALCAVARADVEGTVPVCSGSPVPLREVFAAIGRATGRPELIRVGARPYPPGEVLTAVGDASMLREGLGWRPRLGLQQGIDDTVAWWRERLAGAQVAVGGEAR